MILRRLFLVVLFLALALAGAVEVPRPATDAYDIAFLDRKAGFQSQVVGAQHANRFDLGAVMDGPVGGAGDRKIKTFT